MNCWAVSMSCTRKATLSVRVGTPFHARGGDWPAPSHVYCLGMGAPSLKAGLLSVKSAAAADRTVAVGAGTAFLTAAPPPQATAVTIKARASLRNTGLFYPERGHVADGVEP